MKLFGSLRELVAAVFRKDTYEVTVQPNDGTYTGAVGLKLPPVLTGNDVLVGQSAAQALSNKTLDSTNVVDSSRLDGAQVRKPGTTSGIPSLSFYEDYTNGTNKVSVQAPSALTTDYTFTLPSSSGSGQAAALVSTAGNGTTTWLRYDSGNTGSALVQRDGGGNFTAGTITANLTGNVSGTASNITATSNNTLTTLSSLSLPGSQVSGNISGNAANVTGTVAIANGGTGQATQQAAINALVGAQTANRVLRSDGTNMSLSQVALSTDVSGTLPITSGGTGQTTVNAALNALLPSQGSSANKYLKTDGTNTTWASASGGAGELNAVLNPSGADGITGWAAGTSHNTPTVTSGANNPLDPVVSTAFSFSATAAVALGSQTSTSGVYDAITLPVGLENRKLKVEFYFTTPASADGTWALAVYKGATKLALSTDSSGDTILPAGTTGKFVAYFDTDSTNSYSVNFVQRTRTNPNTLYITNVIVGPGIQPHGAVDSFLGNLTTTGSWASNVSYTGEYWRKGSWLHAIVKISVSGTPPVGNLSVNLPSSLNIDKSALPSDVADNYYYPFGSAWIRDSGTASIRAYVNYSPGSTTSLTIQYENTSGGTLSVPSSVTATTPMTFASGDYILLEYATPIAEWAGSGTVNLAQNDVEYAYNTDATDAPNTNSFGYGPSGTSLPGVTFTAGRLKRVRFNSPIQPTDVITLEIDVSGQGQWAAANGDIEVSGLTVAASTSTTGIGRITRVSTNEVDVYIGQYRAGTSNWAAGTATGKWRLKKVSGGAAVGFGHASATESGLVNTGAQTFGGEKTFQDGAVSGILKAKDGTGLVFQENDGTTTGTVSDAGSWTLGPGSIGANHAFNLGTNGNSLKYQGTGYSAFHVMDATAYTIGQNSNSRVLRVGSGANYMTTGVQLNAGATSWTTYSDLRLKRNVIPLNYGLSEVLALNPISFNYLTDEEETQRRIGFAAQNVQSVIPEAVSDDNSEQKLLGVASAEFIPILVKAIQELKAELDAAKAKIAALETK